MKDMWYEDFNVMVIKWVDYKVYLCLFVDVDDFKVREIIFC